MATALSLPSLAAAQIAAAAGSTPAAEAPPADTDPVPETVVVTGNQTRTSVALPGVEMQKILPGVSPLKAIETLPGVLYITADPWGYNEQNAQLFIHGFAANRLGYTMDGIPLGDQSYGNYNGRPPARPRLGR